MLFFLPANDGDGRPFVFQRKGVQWELFFFCKRDISSHVVAVHRKISMEIEVDHYLLSQPPYRAWFRQDKSLLVVVVTDNDLDIALRDCDILSDHCSLAHLEEDLDSIQANLRVLFQPIDNLQKAHLPSIDFHLNVLLVLRPQENIDGLLDDLIDVCIFAHFLNEVEVKLISLHLRREISYISAFWDIYLLLEQVIADKYFIQGLKFFNDQLSCVKIWLSGEFVQNIVLYVLIQLFNELLFAISFAFFQKLWQ